MARKKATEPDSGAPFGGVLSVLKSATYAGDDKIWELPALPTGIMTLDRALCGGFRYGAAVELLGPEHSSKSLLGYITLANNQRAGGLSCLYDSEGAWNPELFSALGGDPSQIKIVPSFTVESLFNDLEALCDAVIAHREQSGEQLKVVVLWDSLANTGTKHLLDEGMDKRDLTKAAMISNGCALLGGRLRESRICLVITNQVREEIGAADWEKQVAHSPGGRAIKHFCSQRVELKYDGSEKGSRILNEETKLPIGRKIRGVIVKNRAGPASATFKYSIYSESGLPHPEFSGVQTKIGVDTAEAAFTFYTDEQATFGPNHYRFAEGGGAGGWYEFHPEVIAALGSPKDFGKFRKSIWPDTITTAPNLLDCTFLAD